MPRTKTRKPRIPSAHEPAPLEGLDSFGKICREVRTSLHTTQAQLGEWFAVSGKTFARWEDGAAFPSKLQVPGILAAMVTHAPQHVNRASRALGAPPPPRPAAPAGPASLVAPLAVAKVALEGVLFEAAERTGIPSGRAREVAVLALDRVALLGLPVDEAAVMIRAGGETSR